MKVILITGTRKGIGKYLASYYTGKGCQVIGCSRDKPQFQLSNYEHFCLDVADEVTVRKMFRKVRENYGRLDVLINNAGIASMNHSLLTPIPFVERVFRTNVFGTFLFCREAAKIMQKRSFGRIVNFVTVAVPLKIEGEAIYASSKAAVLNMTQILARELASYGITVNAIGPTPIETDLTRNVPDSKLQDLIRKQAIPRFGTFEDISNVLDFFIDEKSDFVTGQVLYLGGI